MASADDSPIDRKSKISKRSSNSYTSDEWRRHRPLITQLYFEEGRTLKDVADYLKREYDFAPTERMYKSRLHTWGLDKKKKEHEMLDLVRQGLQQKGDDKDKVFLVRGRQVTLADALHYFNRKGIKDPSSLLEAQGSVSGELSSPDDADVRTPLSSNDDLNTTQDASDFDMTRSPMELDEQEKPTLALRLRASEFAAERLAKLQQTLNISELHPMPPFRTLSVESSVAPTLASAEDQRCQDVIFQNMQKHYMTLFTTRNLSIRNTTGTWTATSDDALADRFYYSMYHGYSFLWNGQRDRAFDNFYKAFALIEGLLKDDHVGFMIYIFDLIIRHDGTGYEEPLLMLLQHLADMAKTVYESESEEHPIYLIATMMHSTTASRAWLAETTLRRLLDFFQDSIGYFHPETIALLQAFASSLLNRERYAEAAVRFQQLVDAFETTVNKRCYEVCYALRSTSEAYFHMGQYTEALQAIQASIERSQTLPRTEEREIYVRCLRGMAEISHKLGHKDEAVETMQHVVDICRDAFGPEHPFTNRAKMHLKSILKGDATTDHAIPPMVYRLGRGGNAAKYIWISRSSPTRLQA